LNLVGAGDVTVNTNALGQTVIESTGTVIPGTGTGNYVVTAFSGVISAPNNDILTADGSGNAKDSGVLVSSLAPLNNAALVGLTTVANETVINESVQYSNGILNAALFPGADIGAQVNAAIAALPTTYTAGGSPNGGSGGAIFIPQGTYAQTTTIYLPPWVRLFGSSAAGTILNFTPSATAVWQVVVAGLNDPLFYNFGYMGAIEDVTFNGGGVPAQGGANIHSGGVYLGGSDGVLDGSGTINVSGTAVTWVSGTLFSPSTWASAGPPQSYITVIQINGAPYQVASVNSTTSITLGASAGVQNGVPYFVLGSPLIAKDPSTNQCFGFNLNRVRIANNNVGIQWGTNSWSQTIFEGAIYDNQTGVMIPIQEGSNNSGEDLVFKSCTISNNSGPGVYIGAGTQINVVLDSCSLDQNGGWQVQNGASSSQNYVSMTNCYIFTQNSTNLWIQNFGNMIVFGLWATNAIGNTTYSIDNQAQYSFIVVGGTFDYAGSGTLINPASKPSVWIGPLILGATAATYATMGGLVDYLGNAKLQKITTYNGFTTAGNGIPSEIYYASFPNQLGNFGGGAAVTIANTSIVGSVIRVSYSQYLERVGGSSSTEPSLTLSWKDAFGTAHTQTLVALDTTNTIAGVQHSGCAVIITDGSAVTITSAGYASSPSSGSTQMVWAMAVTAELL